MDFRVRLDGSPRRVELLGETSDWRNPIVLEDLGDGWFGRAIDLPPGIYQHKLLVDGHWLLRADGRTRSEGGHRNDLLVVDGSSEPFLFAPASPWIDELDRGGARVVVGVRKPSTLDSIGFSEDGTHWSRAQASIAFEEDEHIFVTAHLPVSAPRVSIAVGDQRFEWKRKPAAERVPAWWKEAFIYTVFVDRFRPAVDRDDWEIDPGRGRVAGGHLEGIRRSLPDLQKLGVDTLYLTPVHVGASVHRYDIVDPLTVDPALGGEAAYEALVKDARTRGMRIVQDFSFAHAGVGFPPYDALETHRHFFQWKDDALVHYGKRKDAPLLDLENAEVQALVLEAVRYWAKRGASGLRLDMTAEVPVALGKKIRSTFRNLVPDGVVFGEVVPRHAWRWREVVDACTDFSFHEAVTKLTTDPQASAEEAFAAVTRSELLRGGDAAIQSVRFLSTHDHPRIATLAAHHGTLARLPLAYAMLATLPGIPMLLYGEEVGLRSDGAGLELEDVWPDRAPMPWVRRDERLRLDELFAARRASPALREGSLTLLFADRGTLVYRREANDDVVDVALNFDAEEKTIALEDDDRPRMVAVAGRGRIEGSALVIPPFSSMIVRRERVLRIGGRRNLALRDSDFVAGLATVHARPSRFFFSVTERCNLKCAHCITHAPERTANNTARTMTPAVLDALKSDFALADYFAFVHGGESLTSPILFDVLGAIRDARAGEPYVAHLLSNGLLLGPAIAERLVRSGVSSLSVSLDGANAVTNDAIRIGGRFDEVTRKLGEVIRWRDGEKIDLRIGLSFVAMQQNLHELEAFVDLGAELGVDWIKLEEAVPATAFAKTSLVSFEAATNRARISRAIARGRARGIVMVDHTVDRAIWRCRLDDETRAFLEADELANRCEIHPCRTPWETACIEPNGDIRAVDFFGPVLGNVLEAPLATMWNAPPARGAREASRLARICSPGAVTCLPYS